VTRKFPAGDRHHLYMQPPRIIMCVKRNQENYSARLYVQIESTTAIDHKLVQK